MFVQNQRQNSLLFHIQFRGFRELDLRSALEHVGPPLYLQGKEETPLGLFFLLLLKSCKISACAFIFPFFLLPRSL